MKLPAPPRAALCHISLMLEGSSHSRGPYEISICQGTTIYDDAPLRGFLSLITWEYPSQQVLITKTVAGWDQKPFLRKSCLLIGHLLVEQLWRPLVNGSLAASGDGVLTANKKFQQDR